MINKILSKKEWDICIENAKLIGRGIWSEVYSAWDNNQKRNYLVQYFKNDKNQYVASYQKAFGLKFRNKNIQVLNPTLFSFKNHIFRKEFNHAKFECDQSDLFCPAWVLLKNKPKNARLPEGIAVYVGDIIIGYRSIINVLFIPWSQYNSIGKEDEWKSIEDSPEFKEVYWNKLAKFYDTNYHFDENKAIKYIEIMEKFLKKLKVRKTARIISLGSGTGIIECELSRRGYKDITLLDQSSVMLAKARAKKLLNKCSFIVSRVEDFYTEEGYDIILTFNTFCWIERKDVARVCFDNLKNGGLFITDETSPAYLVKNGDYYETKNIGLKKIFSLSFSSKNYDKIKHPLYIYKKN